MRELRYLNKYLLKNKWRLLLGVVFVVASNIFALFPPTLIGKSFDAVTELINKGRPYSSSDISDLKSLLFDFGIIVIVTSLIKGFFTFLMRQTIIVSSRLIEYDLKNEIYNKYQTLSQDFYKMNRTGDLMSRITEDVSSVRMYLGPGLMYGINLITLIVIVLANMLRINWELTLYVLTPLPLLAYSVFKVSEVINKKSTKIQVMLAALSTATQEAFTGVRILKSYGIERLKIDEFTDLSEDYRQKNLSLAQTNAAFFPILILLISISTTLTIYFGGLKVIEGEITPGVIAEFLIYINMLTWPVATIGWVTSLIQKSEASQKRINEFLKSDSCVEDLGREIELPNTNIQFKGVSYTYPESNTIACDDLSFEIESGTRVAIMGRTGSGKSTVVSLLPRLFKIDKGEIFLGGKRIDSLDLKFLRKNIALVTQEAFLFSDTVLNNLLFGSENKKYDDAVRAAKIVNMHNEVMGFKHAYDTVVGERGVTLSGGQKQRLSIARAILSDAPILIFDDSLSAVDSSTENMIMEKLGELSEKKTIIFVTNRISTAKKSDKVLILENGKLIAQGSHLQLQRTNKFYSELIEAQIES